MKVTRILTIILMTAGLMLTTSIRADDSQIYVGSTTPEANGLLPNILFVLDTSGSMSNTDNTAYSRIERMKQALTEMINTTNNVNVGLMRFHAIEGGPVLYPLRNIDANVTDGSESVIEVSAMSSSDDAEESTSDYAVTLDSQLLEMSNANAAPAAPAATTLLLTPMVSTDDTETDDNDNDDDELNFGSDNDNVGIRFSGVAIPQGATILSAYLTVKAASSSSSTVRIVIRGEDADDSSPLTNTSLTESSRERTSALVPWSRMPSFSSGNYYTSPQLRSIVQEIVDRTGWVSGNALTLLTNETNSGTRRFYSFDGAASAADRPTLVVQYIEGATGPQYQVSSGNDDAEEYFGNLTSGDLDLVAANRVGVRFQNVDIPPGATIYYADIEFVIDDGSNTGTSNITIYGEDADDANEFNADDASSDNVTNRTLTSSTVAWTGAPRPRSGEPLITPDISSVVKEIVDRSGWAKNNDMAFVFTGSGDRREAHSYNGDADNAPVLRVWYSTYGTGSSGSTQLVGVRFPDVFIPQGAVIDSAHLEFQVGSATSDTQPLNLLIQAEQSDNASPFAADPNNISDRQPGSGGVPWTPSSWNTVGEAQQTPDITTLVQSVVDQTGWCGGNAMAFIVSGSDIDRRIGRAWDYDPASAPRLRVEFSPGASPGCTILTSTYQVNGSTDDAEQRPGNNMRRYSSDLEFMYDGGIQKAVGMRFTNIDIPKDSIITEAYLTFTTDEPSGSTPKNLVVYGENSDNADTFSSADSDITDRPLTTGVQWNNVPGWQTVGETHDTTDLASIVQTIVNRGGWTAGNALAFIVKGGSGCTNSSCRRWAESYDGSPSEAPRLTVKYQGAATVTTVRNEIQEVINGLTAEGWTPITDALYEAASYYTGGEVHYGNTRGAGESYGGSGEDGKLYVAERSRISHPGSYSGAGTIERGSVSNPITVDTNDLCFGNPNAVACRTERITSNHNYISPFEDECQPNYIVFLSDGRANRNHSTSLIPTMTGGSCDASISELNATSLTPAGTERTPDSAEMCGVDLAEYLNTADQSPIDGDQFVRTFTIGFNLDSGSDQDAIEFLNEISEVGGGEFYLADSTDELSSVFQNIIQTIKKESTAFAAPGLSVNAFNRLFNRNSVYLALFEPETSVAWYGNVKKFELCNDVTGISCVFGELVDKDGLPAVNTTPGSADFGTLKTDAKGFWSSVGDDGLAVIDGGAGEVIPTYTGRKVYVYTSGSAPDPSLDTSGQSAGSTMHLMDDSTDTGGSPTTDLKLALLAAGNCGGTGSPDNACLNALIEWMLGKRFSTNAPVGSTANDRWGFSDPMHSRPAVATYGSVACTSADVADSSSPCFEQSVGDPNPDKAIAKLFVGTNNGGVRVIDEYTGVEEFMIVPQAMLAIQEDLKANAGGDHIYGMDGNPTVRVYDCNGDGDIDPVNVPGDDCNGDGSVNGGDNDFVHMYITMRRGGRNIYAYNVTPGAKLTSQGQMGQITPKLIWRIEGGVTVNFSKLGQSWGSAKPTRIETSGGTVTALVFPGGYDINQDGGTFGADGIGNAIYIVDADDGSLLWSASGPVSGSEPAPSLELSDMLYSIPSDIALVDADLAKRTNRLYFTDVGGQVWRVDLAVPLSNSTAARLAALSDGAAAVDRRKFFYEPEVALVTDQYFTMPDAQDYDAITIVSGDRSEPNGDTAQDRIYMLRDYLVDGVITLDGTNAPTNYPVCNSGTSCNQPLQNSDLYDITDVMILTADDDSGVTDEPIDLLQASHGWYIDLEANHDSDAGTLGGEKGFSKATVINGIVFVSSYVPPGAELVAGQDLCSIVVGSSRLYAVDLFTGAPVFADFNGLSDMQITDRYQSLGSGPSGRLLPVFLEEGVTGLVPTGAGALSQGVGNLMPERVYWNQRR